MNDTRILIDCDGVVADLIDAISDMEMFHSGEKRDRHHDNNVWDAPIMRGIWEKLTNPELYRKWLMPYPGARYMIEVLRRKYDVVIATNRPPASLPLINWWQENVLRIEPVPVLFGYDKWKHGGSLLIDDKFENVCDYASRVGPAILVRRLWNEEREFPLQLQYPIFRGSDPYNLDMSGIPDLVDNLLFPP